MTRRLPSVAVVLVLLAAACTGGDDPDPNVTSGASTGDASTYSAQVASSDLAAGDPEAVQVGVFTSTAETGVQLVSFGEIGVEFSFLGEAGDQPPVAGPATNASFVPAPGTELGADDTKPTLTNPSDVAGVYVTPEVRFPDAGIWNATVTASIDGGAPISLDAAFNVYPEHRIPAPGDDALATDSLTTRSKDVPDAAIDSRAQDGAEIPDPELHHVSIADALETERPILVQFSTPVFCVSQFCGPTVEAQEALAQEYDDAVEFIHVEIYRTHTATKRVVNEGAAQWLLRDGSLTEPWMYLIDADGTIVDRWGPLFDMSDVRAELDAVAA